MKLLTKTITLCTWLIISGCAVKQYGQAQSQYTPTSPQQYTPAPPQQYAPAPPQQNGQNESQQYNQQQYGQPQGQQQGQGQWQQQGDQYGQQQPVTIQVFYDELSPYGQWIQSPQYGYVWIPNVGPDFKPYATAGQWVYTAYGWTWVSDYPWGWAAFHYGRWFYDQIMGYAWIPDTQWGPAWVSWRSSPQYYGWQPLGPQGYSYPQDNWVFVNSSYVNSPHVYNYYEGPATYTNVYNQTTVIQNNYIVRNNVQYVAGPNVTEVAQATHAPVTTVAIQQSNKPGQSVHNGGQITMYRPQIAAAPVNNAVQPKPVQVVATREIIPVTQRKATTQPVNNNPNNYSGGNKPAQQTEKVIQEPVQINKSMAPVQPGQREVAPAPNMNNGGQQQMHNVTSAPVQSGAKPASRVATQAKPKAKPVKPIPPPKQYAPTKEEKH